MKDSTTRLWIALFVALVFVCGVSLGIATSAWLGPRRGGDGVRGPFGHGPDGRWGPPEGRPGGPPAFVSERIISRLEADPEFTSEQRERLEALFEEREQRFRAVSREMRTRFEEARISLREDIAEILTPTQMELFDDVSRRGRLRRGPDRAR